MQRVRPVGSKAKDVVSEERPVDNPKPMAGPVDVRAEEPRSGAKPVDDEAYERMPRNGPIADPRIAVGPVKPIMNELTPRDEGCDNQTNIRRPDDGDKSIPTTDGRPATGPKTIIRPQGGAAETETVPRLHKAEVPDWSDGEAMPLIIIDNNSEMLIPTKTNEGLLTDSDNLLPLSHEMNNSGGSGCPVGTDIAKSGQERPFSGYASGRKFIRCVSRHPGISHATGRGQCTASRYDRAPASELG